MSIITNLRLVTLPWELGFKLQIPASSAVYQTRISNLVGLLSEAVHGSEALLGVVLVRVRKSSPSTDRKVVYA